MALLKPALTRRARFESPAEIEEAIDKHKAKAIQLRESALRLEAQANKWFRKWGMKPQSVQRTRIIGRAHKAKERADRHRQRAERIEGGYITHLKSKLAVMRTALLPGMGRDESIPK